MRKDPEARCLCRKTDWDRNVPGQQSADESGAGPPEYPMNLFLEERLLVTVNTDNRTVSGTTVTDELKFIQKNYGIKDEEIFRMMKNAVEVSFADDAVKGRLLRLYEI